MPTCICSWCILLEVRISDPTSSKAQDFSCRCAARAGVLPDIFRAFSITPTPLLNKLWYLSHDFFGCFNVTYPKKLLDLKSGCWTRKIGLLQCYFVAAISLFFYLESRSHVSFSRTSSWSRLKFWVRQLTNASDPRLKIKAGFPP